MTEGVVTMETDIQMMFAPDQANGPNQAVNVTSLLPL